MNKWFVIVVLAGLAALTVLPLISGGRPRVFGSATFEDALAQSQRDGRVLLVKFTASWCGPCKAMDRGAFSDERVEWWVGAHGAAVAVDVDERSVLASRFGVRSIPTSVMFVDGKERSRRVGVLSAEEMIAWLEGSARVERAVREGP